VAVGGIGSAIGDLAGVGDASLDGVKIFADFAADGDSQQALLEGGAQAREEFGFQCRGELAELDFT
jgi:hypothetical protein